MDLERSLLPVLLPGATPLLPVRSYPLGDQKEGQMIRLNYAWNNNNYGWTKIRQAPRSKPSFATKFAVASGDQVRIYIAQENDSGSRQG